MNRLALPRQLDAQCAKTRGASVSGRRHWVCSALVLWSAFFAISCADGRLLVDLRTDYVPAVEFDQVVVEVDGVRVFEQAAVISDDYVRGVRVLSSEETGDVLVNVTLLLDDAVVQMRRVRAEITSSLGVTVVITRDCGDVACPGDGSLTATECLGGTCVEPECTPETPELCGDALVCDETECAATVTSDCASASCQEGSCLITRDDARCDAGEYCNPDGGCTPLMMSSAPRVQVQTPVWAGEALLVTVSGTERNGVVSVQCARGRAEFGKIDDPMETPLRLSVALDGPTFGTDCVATYKLDGVTLASSDPFTIFKILGSAQIDGDPRVAIIDPSGGPPVPFTTTSLPGGNLQGALAIDREAARIYVAKNMGSAIVVYTLDYDGELLATSPAIASGATSFSPTLLAGVLGGELLALETRDVGRAIVVVDPVTADLEVRAEVAFESLEAGSFRTDPEGDRIFAGVGELGRPVLAAFGRDGAMTIGAERLIASGARDGVIIGLDSMLRLAEWRGFPDGAPEPLEVSMSEVTPRFSPGVLVEDRVMVIGRTSTQDAFLFTDLRSNEQTVVPLEVAWDDAFYGRFAAIP